MSDDDELEAPRVATPIAHGLLLGTLASMIAALPATLRVGAAAPTASCWLMLAGGTALVLGPVVAALRVGRPWSARAASVPIGLLIALAPMMVLGRVLKAGTHHRPLGAATFALVAVGLVLGAVAVAARMIVASRGDERRVGRPLLFVTVTASTLLALALARSAFGPGSGDVGSGVMDGVLALALGSIAAVTRLPASIDRAARLFGPILWLTVAIAAQVADRATPAAATALDQAPVLYGPVGWLAP